MPFILYKYTFALQILSYVRSCHDPKTGGYAPAPGHDAHMTHTLSAVQVRIITYYWSK